MIALAFVGLSTSAMAQETEVPVKKHSVATNSFWANWFVSAGGDFNAAYTSEENLGNKNPFSVDRGSFGFNVAVGKWFTPGIGLRTKFQGAWPKRVINGHDHHTAASFNLHEDVMFNLSNLFFGYNEKRVWNFIPYVGVGFFRNMDCDRSDMSFNGGLLNNFRVSKHFSVFLDVYFTAVQGDITHPYGHNVVDNWNLYKKGRSRHWDKIAGASVGLTYNLGKCTWEKTPDVAALMAMNKEQMDALNDALKGQQEENARLREMLAKKPEKETVVVEKTVEVLTGTAQSVFFNIGSSRIASRKDLVNVKEVAEFAKENGKTIVVTGYADSKTGSASYNQKLSQKRAEAVAKELEKMGVNPSNIVVEAKGGVDMISPFSYNRRVTVKVQ